jgi:hypothetical protein
LREGKKKGIEATNVEGEIREGKRKSKPPQRLLNKAITWDRWML